MAKKKTAVKKPAAKTNPGVMDPDDSIPEVPEDDADPVPPDLTESIEETPTLRDIATGLTNEAPEPDINHGKIAEGVQDLAVSKIQPVDKDYWKKLKAIQALEKHEQDAQNDVRGSTCPFASPTELVKTLMAEVHPITNAHSETELIAKVGAQSREITKDTAEHLMFVRIFLNKTQMTDSPVMKKMVSDWGLRFTTKGDPWIPKESCLASFLFLNWFRIPLKTVYPPEFTNRTDLVPIPEEVAEVDPRPTVPASEINELQSQIKMDSQLEAQQMTQQYQEQAAASMRRIAELPPTKEPKRAKADQAVEVFYRQTMLVYEPGKSVRIVNLSGQNFGIEVLTVNDVVTLVIGSAIERK